MFCLTPNPRRKYEHTSLPGPSWNARQDPSTVVFEIQNHIKFYRWELCNSETLSKRRFLVTEEVRNHFFQKLCLQIFTQSLPPDTFYLNMIK